MPNVSKFLNESNKSYFNNRCTYIVNLVVKITRNPKFIFNICRNKRSKIKSFQVTTKKVKLPIPPHSFSYKILICNNMKTIGFRPFFSSEVEYKTRVSGHFEHPIKYVGATVLEIKSSV